MALYKQSGVSVESWVEMTARVPMRYETDVENNNATLYFGQDNDYVLVLNRENLAQVISLGTRAIAELETIRHA
jgi:lipocalin